MGGVGCVYTSYAHSTCIFQISDLTYTMSKIPKDILKKISEMEFLERWNGAEWEKVPVDNKSPHVQQMKELMIAEIEINVTKEALDLGILLELDRDLD